MIKKKSLKPTFDKNRISIISELLKLEFKCTFLVMPTSITQHRSKQSNEACYTHRVPHVPATGARFLPSTVLLKTCNVNKYLNWDSDFGETMQPRWAMAIMRQVSHAFDRTHCSHEGRWYQVTRTSHWQQQRRSEVALRSAAGQKPPRTVAPQ